MRRNRQLKRTVYGPKEDAKLKSALTFAYNEQNEKAHLSIFHEAMNGPPPPVPGLEPGSKLERAHLTLAHETQEKIQALLQLRSERKIASAAKALTKGAEPDPDDRIFERKRLAKVSKHPVREDDNKMDNEVVRVYDPKTNRDQFGHYPVWYNAKKIRKLAHANKVQKKRNLRRIMRGKKPLPPPKPKGDGLNDLDEEEEEEEDDNDDKNNKNEDASDNEMEC